MKLTTLIKDFVTFTHILVLNKCAFKIVGPKFSISSFYIFIFTNKQECRIIQTTNGYFV